ncbi:PREDICTED: glutamate receptor ionotropic, kainate 2-like [Acromyrmex echinatior]|uniref:glutamate receptor ionotropic, kainate 2-like n=1 Tax=Acromyrmex echinatior TaxID=103372 RepID=UPI00058106A0|nr:PREDICTED: glutamate receptor ionotropic, kainate 2-like [Acromyrmex echinatior]
MRPIKIGAIFHKGEEHLQSVFSRAISDTKNENHELVFELVAVIKYIEGNTDSFMTAIAACELLEEGVAAIFGPSSRYTSGIVASIAARFDIPHIEYVWRENKGKENQKKASSLMTINIFPASEQVSQAIVDVIKSMNWRKFAAIYETDEGLSRLQKTLILKGDKNDPIIHTAWKLDEGPDYRSMLKQIRYLPVRNIIIDVKPENIMKVLHQTKEVGLLSDYSDFVITYLDSSILPIVEMINDTSNIIGLSIRENNDIKGIDSLDSAVLYDAVFLLHTALKTLNTRNIENEVDIFIDPIPLSCTNTRKYQVGPNITNIMRENAPYIMEVIDGSTRGVLIGQKRYEGYCIDLINLIAKFLGFKNVVFQLVTDGYGSYNSETRKWNGLIRSILDYEADFAISDLTITSHRASVVDFSLPFMISGFSIIISKPEKQTSSFFPVLIPFSIEVWLSMAIACLVVSIMLFLQARMAPDKSNNPHLCNADPEKNNFKNSFYLTIGCFMQQGSNIRPKASSLRILASMWWFFTLIMYSSYTANQAAFLNMDKISVKGIEDLPKQTKIKYGALKNGATATFFQKSTYLTYKQIWIAMENSKPSVFTSSYEEGINRVIHGEGRYAFLMESGAIEYITERECNLIKIGSVFENRGYGIAMPRNSVYREVIDIAIQAFKEVGELETLKKRWWQERGGGLCKKDEMENNESTNQLGIASLKGVFFVLMCGCSVSFFIAICEFLWNVRKIAVTEKMTPWEVLVAELKFAVNVFAITKPVKIAKSSNISSRKGGLDSTSSTA